MNFNLTGWIHRFSSSLVLSSVRATGSMVLLLGALSASISAQPEAQFFTIQVAACESKAEAELVAAQLLRHNVKAEIVPTKTPAQKALYRVRVGRFTTLAAAHKAAERWRAAQIIPDYWIASAEGQSTWTFQTAGATSPADEPRSKTKPKEKALPELSLGQFLSALSDRWRVKVPETLGIYAAALIAPQIRSVRLAVVLMDETRLRQLTPPLVTRPELRRPLDLRFEPGIKNSPAEAGMKFQQADRLAQSLRTISGYQDLAFDERGILVLGQRISGGSETARLLLRTAVESNEVFEIESVEGSDTIAFGAFLSAQFNNSEKATVAYNRIQLDFQDFDELRGEQRLKDAFDPGFVFLHEVAHGVWELPDEGRGGLGECEAFINQIRRELGLPERVRYHYQVRSQANGDEQGEMLFVEDKEGRRRALKLIWNNRAVNSPGKSEAKPLV